MGDFDIFNLHLIYYSNELLKIVAVRSLSKWVGWLGESIPGLP